VNCSNSLETGALLSPSESKTADGHEETQHLRIDVMWIKRDVQTCARPYLPVEEKRSADDGQQQTNAATQAIPPRSAEEAIDVDRGRVRARLFSVRRPLQGIHLLLFGNPLGRS
jgi:hypothetical protein